MTTLPDITCTPHPRGVEIAKTIRDQIGLDTWLAVSARNPRWWTDSTGDVVFAFRFGSRYGLARWIEIAYREVSDDYDLLAYKIHRNGCKRTFRFEGESTEYEGVYAASLAPLIRSINQQADFQ